MRFRNHYTCPCGTEWTDEWSASCDDRCPTCGTSCSPDDTEELPQEDGEEEWELCGSPRPPVRLPEAQGFLKMAAAHFTAPTNPAEPVPVPAHSPQSVQLDLFGAKHD